MSNSIESREQRIARPLLEFFSNDINFKIFSEVVVLKTRNLPLSVVDWFVTNYAKKNDVSYSIKRPNNVMEDFSVYRSYRAQLKGYKKKEFDPFCRGDTIMLEYQSPIDNSTMVIETAICQLKFFRWAIENLLLNYIELHYDEIYNDMKTNSRKPQRADGGDGNGTENLTTLRRKKNELSKSAFQQIHVSNTTRQLYFK
uniref:Uncharacterized protein n=1 Tax=viral metagenome TaxID=1070528 RepID=A0A6C0BKV2_9ZZZZ